MKKRIVLSLCDFSGVMVKPWIKNGYEAWIVDIQHPPGVKKCGSLVTVGADIRNWLPPRCNYACVFAFPPCTNLAVSGARWFKDKGLAGLSTAIELIESCRNIAEWSDSPWMIENPISTLSTYWRKPDYMFDPCDYGDPYTKKTCLWTGNGFIMPPKNRVEPTEGSKMHLLPPSSDRADKRSVTPEGFARAVFDANNGVRPILSPHKKSEKIETDGGV